MTPMACDLPSQRTVKYTRSNRSYGAIDMAAKKLMITGERRTGTTLIANFLNAQEGITIYRDFLHLERMRQGLVGMSLIDSLSPIQRLQLIDCFNGWNADLGFQMKLDPEQFSSLAEFYRYVLDLIARPGDRIVGHKTTIAHRTVDELLEHVPDLQILYIIRDPRDVVTSALKRFADEENTLFDYIEDWQRSYIKMRNLKTSPDFAGRIFMLRYEDFVLDKDQVLPDLAQFLEVENLVVPEEMTDYGQSWLSNSAFGELRQTLDPTPIGRWREENPRAGRVAEILLASEMLQVGYEVSADIGNEEKARVQNQYMQHCLARAGFRIDPPRHPESVCSSDLNALKSSCDAIFAPTL